MPRILYLRIPDTDRSFLYSTEALGIHIGTKQKANTGDGRGYTDEIAVIRQDFGSPELGSLLESVFGAYA